WFASLLLRLLSFLCVFAVGGDEHGLPSLVVAVAGFLRFRTQFLPATVSQHDSCASRRWGERDLHRLRFLVIAARMEAEHDLRRWPPCQHGSPDVLFAGARSLEDATAAPRLENNGFGRVLEIARVGDNGLSGDRPPHADIGGEVAESFFRRTCHRYALHDWLNRDGLVCHALSFLSCLWRPGGSRISPRPSSGPPHRQRRR